MAKPQFDEEAIRAALQSILNEIHDLNDPSELNELRRIFRSSVPLFSRAYVAGYLLKKARLASPGQQGRKEDRAPREERARTAERKDRKRDDRREEKKESPRKSDDPRSSPSQAAQVPQSTQVPKENQVTLFVGIGRTRRVYPRDLMGLLIDTCKLDKDDIGIIKILDNYSFVDVNTDKAQGVIDVLNEFEFRGRSLSVNFAKKKE